ncbi:MAG: hypothetical protein SO147_01645 [Clostridia bacterium]|nr:hypothetical protein [Clostridia bacterium]
MKRKSVILACLVCVLLISWCNFGYAQVNQQEIQLKRTDSGANEVITVGTEYSIKGSSSYLYRKIVAAQTLLPEDYLVYTANIRLDWDESVQTTVPTVVSGYQSVQFGTTAGGAHLIQMAGNAIKNAAGTEVYNGVQNGVWYQTKIEINMQNHTYCVTVYNQDGTKKLGGMKKFVSIPLSSGKAWSDTSAVTEIRMMTGPNENVTYSFTNMQMKRLTAAQAGETLHYYDSETGSMISSGKGNWPQFNYWFNGSNMNVNNMNLVSLPENTARAIIRFQASIVYPEGASNTLAVGQMSPFISGTKQTLLNLNMMPGGSNISSTVLSSQANASGSWRGYALEMDFTKGTATWSAEGESAVVTRTLPAGARASQLTRLNFVEGEDAVGYEFYQKDFEISYVPGYNLSAAVTGSGSVKCGEPVLNAEDSLLVEQGKTVEITFEPEEGYEISTVSVNGQDMTSLVQNQKLTLENITEDKAIAAVFSEKQMTEPTVTTETVTSSSPYTPEGSTTPENSVVMYSKINLGYGYTVDKAGVYLKDSQEGASLLLPVSQWTEEGQWGIRLYGAGLQTGKEYSICSFIQYQKAGEQQEVTGEEKTFSMDEQ